MYVEAGIFTVVAMLLAIGQRQQRAALDERQRPSIGFDADVPALRAGLALVEVHFDRCAFGVAEGESAAIGATRLAGVERVLSNQMHLPLSNAYYPTSMPRPRQPASPFRYFNLSLEIIRLIVMMYVRFPLSLRNVEDLLAERDIDICHETVRHWWNRFGLMFVSEVRRQRVSAMRGFRH